MFVIVLNCEHVYFTGLGTTFEILKSQHNLLKKIPKCVVKKLFYIKNMYGLKYICDSVKLWTCVLYWTPL